MGKNLAEAFEWSKGIDGLPKNRLLKAVAKTLAPTIHPEDPTFPVRLFAELEMMKNARSLIGRPIGLNHAQMPIYGAYGVDCDWNELQKQLEVILFVPEEYVKKVAEGKIKNVSIEYTWRDTKQTDAGTEFTGLGITRVDLVEGLEAGDPNAIVSLFEATEKRGVVLAEIIPPKKLGEPFAGYTDFADCVAKNQDTGNPEAYCGAIKAQTETAGNGDPPTPQNSSIPLKAEVPLGTPPCAPKVTELEATITKMAGQIQELEKSRASAIDEARASAKREVAAKVDATMPNDLMRNPLAIHIIQDVRKVLRDEVGPAK
jgi:hypothetical protein